MAEKSDKPQLSGGRAFPIIPFVVWTLLSIDTKTDHIIPEPQVEKLWEEVQKLEPQAGDQASDQVVKNPLPEVISDFKDALTQVVAQARQIHANIQGAIDGKDTTMEHVTKMLTRETTLIYEEIKEQVNNFLSEDQEAILDDRPEKAETWAWVVDQTIDKTQTAYIQVLIKVGIPREQAEKQCKNLFAMLKRLLLVLG